MSKKNIIYRACLDALGVAVYAVVFAFFVNHFQQWFGQQQDVWLDFAIVIMLFTISACVTGSLVLLKPILLYLEGQKREAVNLFIYTVGFLAVLALVIIFSVIKVH